MPIVFPKGIVEKVVEKIVEKIIYIAVSLAREFSIVFHVVTKPAIPLPQQVGSTILSISKFLYSLRLIVGVADTMLKFYVISNPTKPSRATVGTTSLSSLWSSEKTPKLGANYSIISNPLKPTPQNLLSLPLPIVYGDYMAARKPTFLFSIASNPDRPPRGTVGVISLSVGVRKSP